MTNGFTTELHISGPFREPRQMLANQEYDGHVSVHDEATAEKLGLAGAPIEGPTHFSQFDPIGIAMWGSEWFEQGCISSHFENMVIDGEQVQATAVHTNSQIALISAVKLDGTSVLRGTMTLGPDHVSTELDQRLAAIREPGELFILDQLVVGTKSPQVEAMMSYDQSNGHLYPFSLKDKLALITEPSSWYDPAQVGQSPWGRVIVPTEMVSVLAAKCPGVGKVRGPAVGLFMDLEVRLINGPIFVGETYVLQNEIVAVGQTRRVENYWTRTTISEPSSGKIIATMLLNQGVFKASFGDYPQDKL